MNLGTAVISSIYHAIKEFVILVDLYSVEAISEAIHKIVNDNDLVNFLEGKRLSKRNFF
ncbi:hypothetical protein ZMO1_ZMO2016 [Zymomonas mobilis subsp. mobilis ZM4 = ATCC 31821]|uniref:Uncharacterized protein n=1 Tax=Zymomonas mobilis subsp. mobilis (strain ATCC 31821 / ZM4 / CP4) TaxID=264203 RepID=D2N0W8_ZYMMO|nr:hypothetical protein ZMO2016 [Zymomonas mobilis subsp. mobilis ZM4 = ATCC 31821]AVZ26168.1 hypothetical protein ZMO2_ZMO2016 [Zymomonas mobilis subsp. mobilis]AVZ28055.1 hypothetical protein ZMO3_ZMO2016 [Zymomonas mobilis subsp. mobilis]AVZ42500.1 hypothetical protein ZMO1_ZMO2016 [Zymomonas mobilis subsp. mobilis ZM4 = ATCC 31821]